MTQERHDAHTFFEKKKKLALAQDDKSFQWDQVLELAIIGAKFGIVSGMVVGSLAGTIAGGILGSGTMGVAGMFLWSNVWGIVGALAGALVGAILGFAIMGIIGIAMEGYRCYLANNEEDQEEADSSPTLS